MLVLFTEQDLVSFGNFMISEARVKPYLENDIIKDKVSEYLAQVNKFDIEQWLRIKQAEEAQAMQAQEATKTKGIEDIPVEEEQTLTAE